MANDEKTRYAPAVSNGLSATASRAKRPGRTSRLESIPAKVRETIFERIAIGVPFTKAAESCGVPYRTFRRWLDAGREDDAREPYRSFAKGVDQALAQFAVDGITEIHQHGAKDWRAKAYLLDHSLPEFVEHDRSLKGAGTQVNVQMTIALERAQTAEALLAAARRVLADDPERLELFMAELASAGAGVVDGEAVEVAELVA